MLVNIDDEIIKLIGPLTVDKKEIEESLNLVILTGLEHAVYSGFNGINSEEIEKLKRIYFFRGMLKMLTNTIKK